MFFFRLFVQCRLGPSPTVRYGASLLIATVGVEVLLWWFHSCLIARLVVLMQDAHPDDNDLLDEEEEEDPSEVEEDDLVDLEFEEDLEAFLNETGDGILATNGSGNSFHSTHQSLCSSSMANQLGGLAMNQVKMSNSSSSKRKTIDGDKNTATYNLIEMKKPKL